MTTPQPDDLEADLIRRADACRGLNTSNSSERLAGKEAAYRHAAEMVAQLRPAEVGEAVAWPENLDWSMVDSGALCHWRASFGDYVLDVVQGHDKIWSYRVNNTGRMNFDGLESATAAAMEDFVGRLKRRWAQAKETMRLYATPAHPDAALMERVRTVLEEIVSADMATAKQHRDKARLLLSDLKAEAGR